MMNTKTRPLSEVGGPPYSDGYWSRYEGHSRTPPEGTVAASWLEGWDQCDSEIKSEPPLRAPARELLAKLRAGGVEPVSDDDVQQLLSDCLDGRLISPGWPVKLAADLLEARAKLAEVREWAEDAAVDVGTPLGDNALCVLKTIDREPEP